MSDPNKLTLLIDGQPMPFQQAELSFSIEQLAQTFRCDIPRMTINRPLSVQFLLAGQTVLRGHVDQVDQSLTGSDALLSISGRSQSANMIDSRITMDAEYDQTIDRLLRKIASPFGLSVHCAVPSGQLEPIAEFQINAESPVDNIAQLIREQGLILLERQGVLAIERPAQGMLSDIALEVGRNIAELNIHRAFDQLFHHIEVQGALDDASAVITYAPANPQRCMVIVCDQLQTKAACHSRAQYEHDLAIAKSLTATATLPGIFPALTGAALNRVIQATDKRQGFQEMLAIQSLSLSVTDTESATHIELIRPFKEQHYV